MAGEKKLEDKLVRRVKSLGFLCWKMSPVGVVGVPDRLCLLAKGRVIFVEVKNPNGGKLRPIQKRRKKQLEDMGFKVYVLDSEEILEEIINDIKTVQST